jgi:hypothetical protein
MTRRIGILAVVIALGWGAGAMGEILVDGNSAAHLDLSPGSNIMDWWQVNGIDHLCEQSFWIRLGDETPTILSSLALASSAMPAPNYLTATYADPNQRYEVDLAFLLAGGSSVGPVSSDLAESIRIRNTSGAPLAIHFYQYVDFNVAGTWYDDGVQMSGGMFGVNTVDQWEGPYSLAETVVTPRPSHYQADWWHGGFLGLFSDASYNLSNKTSEEQTDLVWAFQWDTTIAAGGSFVISKDKLLTTVPEPGTLGLLVLFAVCMSGIWVRRWR